MIELDEAQREATLAGPTDVFISAGAGSGKTRVLTARFVSAVLGTAPYPASDPTALPTITYTDKAAAELVHRIHRSLADAGRHDAARSLGDAWISTIHRMCARILRQHALYVGVDPHFSILDQVGASVLEAEAFERAVAASLADDTADSALFDAFDTATLMRAALHVRASMYALGARASSILTVGGDDVTAQLKDAAASLQMIAESAATLRATKSVDACATRARHAASEIERALADNDAASAASTLIALSAKGLMAHASIEGLPDLVSRARAAIAAARQAGAQMGVWTHERAFIELVSRLEDTYAAMKRERGALDFEDLQVHTARLLEAWPEIAEHLRRQFKMIMVDEFQDTNGLQLGIVERLADGNLCTVGDANQSIYSFRHADPEVFRARAGSIERRVELRCNYRMDPPLLAAVNALLAEPSLLGAGFVPLLPREPGPDDRNLAVPAEVHLLSGAVGADANVAEARHISSRVAELLGEGFAPGDIAVLLSRLAGGQGAAVEAALAERAIPVALASGGAFFESTAVAEVRALLMAIGNVLDESALVTLLAGRLTGLSPASLFRIRAEADRRAQQAGPGIGRACLWSAISDDPVRLEDGDAEALARTVRVLREARQHLGMQPLEETVLDALYALDADLVYLSSGSDGARAWGNALKLARLAGEYEAATGGSLGGFLEYLELRQTHGTGERQAVLDDEVTAVRVMSIHAAKGLEFPAVIVAGLSSGPGPGTIEVARVDGRPTLGMRLPGPDGSEETIGSARVRAVMTESHREETRRLLYVAFTRAMQSLTVVARTDRERDADDTPAGWVRAAVGMSGEGAVRDCVLEYPPGVIGVRSFDATIPTDARQSTPGGGAPSRGPCGSRVSAVSSPGLRESAADLGACGQAASVPLQVSYTSLSAYRACPYRYFLTSVIGLPQAKPDIADARAAFGTAVHAVLERCDSADADVSALAARAARATGVPEDDVDRIETVVRAFLASPTGRRTLAAPRVRHEVPIALPLAGALLVGAIDLLAVDSEHASVIDFKTGDAPLSEDDARDRYELQAWCYALAAMASGASEVQVVFAELERDREVVFEYGAGDRSDLEARVGEIVARIASGEFGPLPAYDAHACEHCPGFGGLCAVTRPRGDGAA